MPLHRLDSLLVLKNLAASRTQAQKMIAAGQVEIHNTGQWITAIKPSQKFAENTELKVTPGDEQKYVSRAGLKLEGALKASQLDITGYTALDIGQSTGGFTDCLLAHGARQVVGIDVGHDQLAPRLKQDERVVCLEGINARALPLGQLLSYSPEGFDLVVMDVSFISQNLILPGIPPLLRPAGKLISLVKPQFEVGREGVGKGGLVRDPTWYPVVQQTISEQVVSLGLRIENYFASVIEGGDGNREFFLIAGKP